MKNLPITLSASKAERKALFARVADWLKAGAEIPIDQFIGDSVAEFVETGSVESLNNVLAISDAHRSMPGKDIAEMLVKTVGGAAELYANKLQFKPRINADKLETITTERTQDGMTAPRWMFTLAALYAKRTDMTRAKKSAAQLTEVERLTRTVKPLVRKLGISGAEALVKAAIKAAAKELADEVKTAA